MDSACMPFFPLWSSTSQCLLKRSCQIPETLHQQVSISHKLTNRNLKWWWWFWLPYIESVFNLATIIVLQGDACPPPYTHVPGDISGPGSLDDQTHSLDNKTRSKIIWELATWKFDYIFLYLKYHVQMCWAVQWEFRLSLIWIFWTECCLFFQQRGEQDFSFSSHPIPKLAFVLCDRASDKMVIFHMSFLLDWSVYRSYIFYWISVPSELLPMGRCSFLSKAA